MAKRTLENASGWDEDEALGLTLTSGDLARMLHVDLKTIHNWVAAGHLRGRRTEGRHLRFGRPEIVRFMRRFGYPIPPALMQRPARVLVIGAGRDRYRRDWEQAEGPFAGTLRLGAGAHEVAIAHLDAFPQSSVPSWVSAIRSLDTTECIALVGISAHAQRRRAFIAAGGDAVLPPGRASALISTVAWFVGALRAPPRGGAEFSEAYQFE